LKSKKYHARIIYNNPALLNDVQKRNIEVIIYRCVMIKSQTNKELNEIQKSVEHVIFSA